jgi:hypothetical protein
VLASVTVTNPGSGYTSIPTFTIAAGGTPGTVQAQMAAAMNTVTSINNAIAAAIHPVVFLAPVTAAQVTAGSYVFVQELGIALVLGASSLTNGSPAAGDTIIIPTSPTGPVQDPTQSTSLTYALWSSIIGEAIDVPVASQLFKVQLDLPVLQG